MLTLKADVIHKEKGIALAISLENLKHNLSLFPEVQQEIKNEMRQGATEIEKIFIAGRFIIIFQTEKDNATLFLIFDTKNDINNALDSYNEMLKYKASVETMNKFMTAFNELNSPYHKPKDDYLLTLNITSFK